MRTLEEMVSGHCYDEIKTRVQEFVGDEAMQYIWPGVKQALEVCDGPTREKILFEWLEVNSCRICDVCGNIMNEGWYNMGRYACSDECVMEQDGISEEEFKRYKIYKSTIKNYLKEIGDERCINDIPDKEIESIIDSLMDELDAYYTEWY